MRPLQSGLRESVAFLVRGLLAAYFRRIELFHRERVPGTGPALFTSNHPGSLTDAFIIGTAVPRRVYFVATVRLFGFRPLAWFLTQCGIIPVNRVKDDPKAMRSVMNTFEACFLILERGEAVGIFPEGITYDDSQLKTIKTGAARMALEVEDRHRGSLGLKIVPVGLTYSAKERYRSEVLVHFGEPILVRDFLSGYADQRKTAINELNAEIERRIQSLILHLPRLEHGRLVDAVKRLYLERLKLGNLFVTEPVAPQVEELMLSQGIADAVDHVLRNQPERYRGFVRALDRYEQWLRRLRLSDEIVERFSDQRDLVASGIRSTLIAALGAPIAVFGWIHRWLPFALVAWVAGHWTDAPTRKAQTPHAVMLAGLVSFGAFYTMYVWLAHRWLGWPATIGYALALPVSGVISHYYGKNVRRLIDGVRALFVLFRVPFARRRILAMRTMLIAEIEDARSEYRHTLRAATGPTPSGA